MTGYDLSRNWFDWCFENPDLIKPNHTALYFFCIEHCNRLGWKKKFGLPTNMAKEAIGIKSYGTYISTLNDLVEFGFIEMIERPKNQFSSNIVALSKFDKAPDKAPDKASIKALDKATVTHASKQVQSTHQSIDSIDKPITNNQEQIRIDKQEEVLKFWGFSLTPQFITQQRMVREFFLVQYNSDKLDDFLIQFDAYKKYYTAVGFTYRHNLNNFLGSQNDNFEDGKWKSQNWCLKDIPEVEAKLHHPRLAAN